MKSKKVSKPKKIQMISKESLKNVVYEIIQKQESSIKPDRLLEFVGFENKERLDEVLQILFQEGKIVTTRKNKLVSSKSVGLIAARILSISKNFSFAEILDNKELPDVYIPIGKLKGACVGDIVLLKHVRQSKKGLLAYVDRVTYKTNRFVKGVFRQTKKGPFFIADKSYKSKIPVDKRETMDAKTGDKVQAFLMKTPKQIMAKIIKVYGSSDSAKVCSDAIIDSYNIPTSFSQDVINEVTEFQNREISAFEMENRLDLRAENVFTIDGENAKDLDDAISIKKSGSNYELGVHIADVSHYVTSGSFIDREAMDRGTSVYFANRVIPMLPKEISNGVCSLNPSEDKLTFSVLLKINLNGEIVNAKFAKSIINSKVRGVYSEINQIFDGTASESIVEKYECVKESLLLSKELAQILFDVSEKRGVLTFAENEPYLEIDENGVCVDVKPFRRGVAEKIIEQFMIKANEAVAVFARKKNIPFVYRTHSAPDIEHTKNLIDVCNIFGFRCHKPSNDVKVSDLNFILKQAQGTSFEKMISNRVLRSMSKAVYDTFPNGHFGLVLEDYCHFTSPIRRYPDLAIHRILTEVLAGTKKNKLKTEFEKYVFDVSETSTQLEIRAMNAERDANKCYMAEYANNYLGQVFEGTISGMMPRGMFVELDSSIEGFIRIDMFKGRSLIYDGFTCFTDSITGKKFCIGDGLKIRIIGADVSTGNIDFEPV